MKVRSVAVVMSGAAVDVSCASCFPWWRCRAGSNVVSDFRIVGGTRSEVVVVVVVVVIVVWSRRSESCVLFKSHRGHQYVGRCIDVRYPSYNCFDIFIDIIILLGGLIFVHFHLFVLRWKVFWCPAADSFQTGIEKSYAHVWWWIWLRPYVPDSNLIDSSPNIRLYLPIEISSII
jgi:hypothetical protein